MKNDIVEIKCYGKITKMERQKAIQKFLEGVILCEGSEKERYSNILADLISGKNFCSDGVDD